MATTPPRKRGRPRKDPVDEITVLLAAHREIARHTWPVRVGRPGDVRPITIPASLLPAAGPMPPELARLRSLSDRKFAASADGDHGAAVRREAEMREIVLAVAFNKPAGIGEAIAWLSTMSEAARLMGHDAPKRCEVARLMFGVEQRADQLVLHCAAYLGNHAGADPVKSAAVTARIAAAQPAVREAAASAPITSGFGSVGAGISVEERQARWRAAVDRRRELAGKAPFKKRAAFGSRPGSNNAALVEVADRAMTVPPRGIFPVKVKSPSTKRV